MILHTLPDNADPAAFLIVGAGAVGLAMAVMLSRGGHDVVVVEAGSSAPDPDYVRRNDAVQSGPLFHQGLTQGRYKGLGGTTRLWGGQLLPLTPADFAANPAFNKPGWPLDWSELAPWYDTALALLGVPGGREWVTHTWREKTGSDLRLSDEAEIAPSVWLRQPDFSALWRAELSSRSGPRILTDHEAKGFAVDSGGRVTGVHCETADGRSVALLARHTILACGTFETARLLLRAQLALPQSPLASNRHVGKWFVDHLHGYAGRVAIADRAALGRAFDSFYARNNKLTPKLHYLPIGENSAGRPQCAFSLNSSYGVGEALRDLRSLGSRVTGGSSVGVLQTLARTRIILPLVWRYLKDRRSNLFVGDEVQLGIEVEQIPSTDSYIYLEPGVPPERARVGLHWSLDGRELVELDNAVVALGRTFAANGFGTVTADPRIAAHDPAYFSVCHDANHQIGGARMAASAEHGVVDSRGQVFGMPGLHVAGAPTFPSAGFANPTLTAIALGLRTASLLAGDLA
jgi:GMC oxidoreductase